MRARPTSSLPPRGRLSNSPVFGKAVAVAVFFGFLIFGPGGIMVDVPVGVPVGVSVNVALGLVIVMVIVAVALGVKLGKRVAVALGTLVAVLISTVFVGIRVIVGAEVGVVLTGVGSVGVGFSIASCPGTSSKGTSSEAKMLKCKI